MQLVIAFYCEKTQFKLFLLCIARRTSDTNLARVTEAENTAEGKTSEPPAGFSASDAAREKSSRKRRLNADNETEVSEKEDDEYADFKKFRAVAKHDEFKFDLPENLAQYTNDHFNKFIQEKDLQERILVENPVPLNLQSLRKMDAFMRDLIFEKKGGSRLKFSQAATKITRCYGIFIQSLEHS